MKKIFTLLLFLSLILPACGAGTPYWDEFCPENRLNAEYINIDRYAQNFSNTLTHPMLYKICLYSIIGTPIAMAIYMPRYREQVENNYWAKRKQDFDNEIESCNQMSNQDNKISCYMDIRRLENDKTSQYENQLYEEQVLSLQRMQLYEQEETNRNLRNIKYNHY